MDKSDQHKKLVETSGEKTLDFLIGVIWEGMSQKRHAQNSPYTMQASQVRFTWVYRGSKKKTLISIFPPNWAILRHFCFFTKKNNFFGLTRLSKNRKKIILARCRLTLWNSKVEK